MAHVFQEFLDKGGARRALDLTGQTFGHLTAVGVHSRSRNGQFRWAVRCVCGVEKDVLSTHLVGGKTKSCGCKRPRGSERKQWTGCGELSGQFWNSIQRGADGSKGRKPIPFTLTIGEAWDLFIRQGRCCALSGIPLEMGQRFNDTRTASLDRIDSGGAYALGNVQWVHKDINTMKGKLSQARFIDLCRVVTLSLSAEP